MPEEKEIIVIKKVKAGHGGHHGGAWKVAYADFVTAMMALFLVLWLIAMLSKDTKNAVAHYFRSYTIFPGDEAGGGKGISVMKGGPIKLDENPGDASQNVVVMKEKLVAELGRIIEEKLREFRNQIIVANINDGVRIELMESEDSPMFEVGKANLLARGSEIIEAIAEPLKAMPNRINIEGHTDSSRYPTEDYTNWELAADRANAARRELIRNGIDPAKISRVVSYADVTPMNAENPFDPINRRVSIFIETARPAPGFINAP